MPNMQQKQFDNYIIQIAKFKRPTSDNEPIRGPGVSASPSSRPPHPDGGNVAQCDTHRSVAPPVGASEKANVINELNSNFASALNSSSDPSSVSGGAGQPRLKGQWRRSTACGLPALERRRNTKRGLRSEIKIIERRIKRSRKRNLARQTTRKIKSGKLGPFGAQEPEQQSQNQEQDHGRWQ